MGTRARKRIHLGRVSQQVEAGLNIYLPHILATVTLLSAKRWNLTWSGLIWSDLIWSDLIWSDLINHPGFFLFRPSGVLSSTESLCAGAFLQGRHHRSTATTLLSIFYRGRRQIFSNILQIFSNIFQIFHKYFYKYALDLLERKETNIWILNTMGRWVCEEFCISEQKSIQWGNLCHKVFSVLFHVCFVGSWQMIE